MNRTIEQEENYMRHFAELRTEALRRADGKTSVQGDFNCFICGKGKVRYKVFANSRVSVRCSYPACHSWEE